jgi:hypothetical protein
MPPEEPERVLTPGKLVLILFWVALLLFGGIMLADLLLGLLR